MHTTPRVSALLLSLAAALALPSLPRDAAAQAYPNKPIHMIVPLAAASAVDNAARIITTRMGSNLGQQIVIENQPGAAGIIGTERVARAAPDGYTIGGFNDSIMTMLPNLISKISWDIVKDFEPVSLVATVEWGLVAGSEAPYRNAQDLIAAAKAAPGKINYGSGGNGSPQHIAMALFADRAGVQLTHVPYKGATQAAMGVAGNEIQVAFQGLATVNSLIQAKKLRLIGVTTPRRMTQFPDAPTVSESGLSGFEFNSWFAVMAPAGTPRDIVNRLNAEILKAMNEPEQRNLLLAQGLTPRGSTPAELGVATREQLAKYQRLIKAANITAE